LRSAAVCEARGGRIALQAAGGEVEFRNVVLLTIIRDKTD